MIGQTISRSGVDVEQNDDHVAVGIYTPDRSNRRLRHSGVKRAAHLLEEFLSAVIGLGQRR